MVKHLTCRSSLCRATTPHAKKEEFFARNLSSVCGCLEYAGLQWEGHHLTLKLLICTPDMYDEARLETELTLPEGSHLFKHLGCRWGPWRVDGAC